MPLVIEFRNDYKKCILVEACIELANDNRYNVGGVPECGFWSVLLFHGGLSLTYNSILIEFVFIFFPTWTIMLSLMY